MPKKNCSRLTNCFLILEDQIREPVPIFWHVYHLRTFIHNPQSTSKSKSEAIFFLSLSLSFSPPMGILKSHLKDSENLLLLLRMNELLFENLIRGDL